MALMLDELKEGDVLIADGGFTCIEAGSEVTLEADEDGELFFKCTAGPKHWLNGQIADDGSIVGLTRKVVQ